ncbi:flagellar biosynthesis protein FliQ [Escherichia coli]|uniref:Flagellar biosynthesis protein FliQ n=1 Tax=Escherichia coli TaxID=562 RepID=A0A376Y8X9_ECOLX|nr:flagellar biosynthesis protein FliQ [Escherichia coli]
MTPESVMMMGTEAMKVALALAAPLLLVALVTGLIISILQAATQINEMTLSFIPKIIARIYRHYYCRTVDAQSVAGLRPHLVH